jgi:hypothetical protein
MKKIGFIFCFLFSAIFLHAQDKLPSFGTIDKADLEMKDCDFDLGAEAVVLLDVGEAQYAYIFDIGWVLEAQFRVRLKILKESALRFANVQIEFFNEESTEDLSDLTGITYNLDDAGNIIETKMEKKEKYKRTIDDEKGLASFAMPGVKVGSVIEYKYKISVSTFGYFPKWSFQHKIPVKYSAYHVTLPHDFQYTIQTITRQQLEKKNIKFGGTWYIMRNIQGFKEEPESSGVENYLQSIDFQLSKIDMPGYYYENTWKKVIERLIQSNSFGLVLKKNIRPDNDLDAQLAGKTSDKEKIKIIYEYVQSNMLWNGEYAFRRHAAFEFKEAWDKKIGNIADINFILLKFLQKNGIDAKPLLVSTRDNGAINVNYPFLNQFNAVMVYVKDGDQRYVMNAADKFNQFDLVPDNVVYTNALVVDKESGGLVGLNNDKKFETDIYFTAYPEGDGSLTGSASLTSHNYARNSCLNIYSRNKLKELLEDNEGVEIKVDSISVKNQNNASEPFLQEVQFSGNMQFSGGYYFLPLSVFSQLGKNPFTGTNRLTGINFNYPKKYVISASYVLTDDFMVDELPKNKKMMLPDSGIVFMRITQKENNTISFKIILDINEHAYEADAYPMIKDFFKNLYAILDERVVLKKK